MLHNITAAHSVTEASSLVELLSLRSYYQPDNKAYLFHRDGGGEDQLTYRELDQRARAIAAYLQQHGISGGERALLFYPQGLDYISAFLGSLYAGVVAVPTPHPHMAGLGRYLSRLKSIVIDAQPRVVLTNASILARIENILPQYPELRDILWVAIDDLPPGIDQQWLDSGVDGETLAFLQYTSGSTSTPKGVMLTHSNLLQNHKMLQEKLEHPAEAPFVGWIPLYHDMGMIATALQALYTGAPCVLMTPQSFVQKPFRWLEAISRYRAYTSFAPNFAYDLCIRKITPEQRATLDLSCWRKSMNGAEPVRASTIQAFVETFAPCGFRLDYVAPSYGMAEASVYIAGPFKGEMPVFKYVDATSLEQHRVVEVGSAMSGARSIVGHGQTGTGHTLAIVDPQTLKRCAPNEVGEIWFAGPSVGQGYWRHPQATAAIFQSYIAETDEGPFLRTGDLGFYKDGQLYITGRLKDVIIIDGRNHYPQDIELTVECAHAAIRPAYTAAFSVNIDDQECLVIAAELERHYRPERQAQSTITTGENDGGFDYRSIIRAIRRAISEEHDLAVYKVLLLKPATIHKTSSGKIQRSACRQSFLENTLEVWGQG